MAEDAAHFPPEDAELLVCVTCKREGANPLDEVRPGARLLDDIATKALPEGVRVVGVNCLQNCEGGCTVALRGGHRWTYVFGNLCDTSQTEMLLDGAARYHATADGLIPWRERPEHFKRNCVARIPPPTLPEPAND